MENKMFLCYIGILTTAIIVIISAIVLILKPKKIFEFLNKNYKKIFLIGVIVSVLGRYLAIFAYFGVTKFVQDIDVFIRWANTINDSGLKGFMTEYPAAYLYLIAGIEYLLRLAGFGDNLIITTIAIKSPAIICEVLLSVFIYKYAVNRINPASSLLIVFIFLFSPSHIINSSMWGQVDGIFILFLVLSLYFLDNNKRFMSATFYLICAMFKVQAIFFAPVYGMIFVMPLITRENKITARYVIRDYLLPVIACVGIFALLTLPFKNSLTDIWIIDFFKHITTEHPFNTNSAVNLFGLHGGNAVDYTNSFLFFNYRIWGNIFIVLTCIACAVLSIKTKGKHIYLLSAFCIASVFTLGASMHERYILPIIVLLIMSFINNKNINVIILGVVYTILTAINQSMILFDLFGGRTSAFRTMSAFSVAAYIYICIFFIWIFYLYKSDKVLTDKTSIEKTKAS